MENDHELRRKYRRALNAIWIFVVLVLAVSVWGVIGHITAWDYQDKIKVSDAKAATGRCGNQQIVVIDEKRVAVAGEVYSPEAVSTFRFEGGPEDLRVLSERGEPLMERKSRR